jgi:hypothetical protein
MASVPISLSLALTVIVAVSAAHAQSSPISTTNPVFQGSLDRMAQRSALWREALETLRISGRRAVIVTPEQVRLAPRHDQQNARFDDAFVAEVAPVVQDGSRVDLVLVVVNLALLQERHHRQQLLPIEFDMDLDRILVHEVYGHAVPLLLAGDLSGRCPDPQPRERAADACSIRRENAVRAELGLGRRVDYGLLGLNLSRRF